jgi:hypothetical protein
MLISTPLSASTQPGTGVPVVVAGSEVVANKIDKYLRGYDTDYSKEYAGVFILTLMFGVVAWFVMGLFPADVDPTGFPRHFSR